MKKVIVKTLALLLAIFTVFGMAACNSTKVQDGIVDTSKVPDAKGKIKFSYTANTEAQENAANAFIDAFNVQFPKVTVERDYDYAISQAPNRIASGDIGDVFYMAESDVYNFAVTHKALMDLSYYMTAYKIDRSDIYQGIFAAGMLENGIYYVARDFNQMIMVYNKDQVTAKNASDYVQDGWTWTTFLEDVCPLVTGDGYYAAQINLAYDPVFVPLLSAEVGKNEWYDTVAGKINLTDEGTAKLIESLIFAYNSGYVDLGLGDRSMFNDMKPVFRQCVYLQAESFGKEYDQDFIDWDMIHVPLVEGKIANSAFGCGSSGVGVFNRTKNPDAAAAFALFFYTQEGQTAFNGQTGGSVPVLASLKNAAFWQHADDTENGWSEKNWAANIYRANDFAVIGQLQCILPTDVADTLEEEWGKKMAQVVNGELQLDKALADLETLANEKWQTLMK